MVFSLLLSAGDLTSPPLQEVRVSSSLVTAVELGLFRSAAHSSTEPASQEALLDGVQAAARSTSEPKLVRACCC